MIGLDVKRGVSATMERVTANAGVLFESLQVVWTGNGAGISFERVAGQVTATVILPAIDDLKEVSKQTFHNLIAFALHEGLGHAVFTDNKPWDDARMMHGAFLGNLINGLEDPRIERCAIESGFAPNAKQLFENLLNSMLERDGHTDADDIKNIPFLLAVEGRRLNGYQVNCPCVIDQSPFAADLWLALKEAQAAKSTSGVVQAALKLFKRLQDAQNKTDTKTKGKDKSQRTDGSDKPEQGSEEQGQSLDQSGNKASDQEGKKDSDQFSDKKDDEQGDQPSSGWSNEGGRDVEPTKFIDGELKDLALSSDATDPRPFAGKPQIATFDWV